MRILITIFLALCMVAGNLSAANKKQTVTQVTSAVTITENVDYIITDATPFTTAGSVNIENTEHAVVIIKRIKPSIVIKSWMNFIYINGEKAVNGTNCQVRMYDRGAIVFPYGKDFKPLTCYTEKGFQGESSNSYTEGSNGGFMKDLSSAMLNNNFQSFKLKRGYMVTFALGKSGWGYSRCFIADQEDLEMDLPANMNGRVSSYRLFKWYNAHKAGLASNGNYNANAAVNSSWCYDWGQGNESNLPDVEWVPNHIYEDWPPVATCGGVTGSCHMKTNNEPGNSADDHPQSVDVVLDNWQNLMRTGMRLCSESSHDGSWGHLRAFIDSIDARGWRCDLLDLHCYWGAPSFNDFSGYYSSYGGRPIWISEWVWGASWNAGNWSSGGIFAQAPDGKDSFSAANQQKCYEGTKPILDILNASKYVERYAYWNSEADASKIYKDGQLSTLGKYYANMDEGMGYNASIQKVPNVVCLKPQSLTATYNTSTSNCSLKWDDPNGDMLDSLTVECMRPGTNKYVWIGNVKLKDASSKTGASYTFTDTHAVAGANYYRIAAYPIGNKTPKYSGATSVSVTASAGNETIQYGKLDVTDLDAITVNFNPSMSASPAVFMGVASNKNATMNPVTLIDKASTKSFTYMMTPWAYSGSQTLSAKETIPFLAITPGNYKYGAMDIEVGITKVKSDTVQVTFQQPFPEGVMPVVIAEARPNIKTNTLNIRIWDVTNTGFKIILLYEGGVGKGIAVNQNVFYLACTTGQAKIANNMLISAGISNEPIYGNKSPHRVVFQRNNLDGTIPENADSLAFDDPLLFGALQTFNYPAATVLRRSIDITTIDETGKTLIYGTRIIRNVDTSAGNFKNDLASADRFGWICLSTLNQSAVSEDLNGDGVVDTQDVLCIYQYIQTGGDGNGFDINGDGIVDTQDVLRIYDYIMNH
ncbi:MAG: hypothetical protein J5770_05475 [Bacteroidaceae bacterium]|nr:hypothetical protein [Bacteroidaceae bacterium]